MNWALATSDVPRLGTENVLAYVGGVLGVCAAVILTALLSPLRATPTVPFTAAIVATAWLGGRGPALVATLLSALAVDFFFLPPVGSVFSNISAVVCDLNFVIIVSLICSLQESYQRIARELRVANDNLGIRVQERTADLTATNERLVSEIEQRRHAESVLQDAHAKLRISMEATETALSEKETLYRELQHRVKNNLQVISSLLGFQMSRIQDQASRELFKECQQRVRAIAQVHDRQFRMPDLSSFQLDLYLTELVQALLRCYSPTLGDITSKIIVDKVVLESDSIIPCALIVNELVCNALKYAFPDRRSGEVRVELRSRDDQIELVVADDGVGISGKETLEMASASKSCRLWLINFPELWNGQMAVECPSR
ncbi:sensor histidine kinase [Schlesneria paludicola]|uniref:sensor histidine kinase n=1 Tax=Schlesneria paludicola TaxID=360056 RepID=UPI00029B2363|nr:histidine kinase dimerization/phosphoacceptor domain -containing protein [Schlesneria paludicola]